MGNHKFRLADMMPNAWFFKLRDISRRTREQSNTSHSVKKKQSLNLQKPYSDSQPRNSLNFNTPPKRANRFHNSPVHPNPSEAPFQDNSPRKSLNKKRVKRKTIYKPSPKIVSLPSVSAGSSCHVTTKSVRAHHNNLYNQDSSDYLLSALESSSESFLYDFTDYDDGFAPPQSFDDQIASWSRSSDSKISSSTNDIIIDMNHGHHMRKRFEDSDGCDALSDLELPYITKKTEKVSYRNTQVKDFKNRPVRVKIVKEQEEKGRVCGTQKKHPKPISSGRKSSANSSGIRLRVNSPKIQVSARKSVSKSQSKGISDSFAVVKSSVDPQRDFKESMVEMVLENNIRESKDLEDLLVCYLSLNSNEYHDLIIKAFEQIWFDMTNQRL